MITTLLFDFSRVLLHPKDPQYTGTMNGLNNELSAQNPHYVFFDYFVINTELLDFLKPLKATLSINMFTTDVIQEKPEVKAFTDPIFERTFKANDLGIAKTDPHAYAVIAKELGKLPEEILFVDDTAENIAAAQQAGLQTIQYTSNATLFEKINQLIH